MKKFLAILAVLALTVFSSIAFAEVTLSGSIDTRGQYYKNTDADLDTDVDAGDVRRTQTRVRLEVSAKNADNTARGKVQIENDWDTWGRLESPQGNSNAVTVDAAGNPVASDAGRLKLREAWVDFNLPGLPGHLKGGHQLLQLGQGWFFRSMKYGSDAWLLGFPGKNTLAFVDVKVSEVDATLSDDIDAYVILDVYKIDDNNSVGIDLTQINDRQANALGVAAAEKAVLNNIGLNYTGKLGPVALKAELDVQMGSQDVPGGDVDYSGNQLVLQASLPMDALTLNATLAMGSGNDTTTADEDEGIQTFLDKDQHYTLLYEFNVAHPLGGKNFGFKNTTAINVGANYAISKSISAGADVWLLTATEVPAGAKDDIGMEIDARLVWKMYDALTLNWQIGMLQSGDAYGTNADDVTGSQVLLSYKF